MATTNTLLEFRCTGGTAGNNEHLVVDRDGHAVLSRAGGTSDLELGPATLTQLRQELEAAHLDELPEDLRRPPGAGEPQPDVVEYSLTANGHTVRALGNALPPELIPVVETLNVLIHRDAANRPDA